MLENKKNKRAYKKIQIDFKSIAILTFFSILAVFITYVLYSYTSNLLKERLQDRLIAISSTAATQFSVNEIDQIKDINDMKKPAFASIINKLQKIRAANENIRFAYLMRKTNDASTLEFIADADSLTPQDELDVNENGIIEETAAVIPATEDSIHRPEFAPKITVTNPVPDLPYGKSGQMVVAVEISSRYPVSKVDYFINGNFAGSVNKYPWSFSFLPSSLEDIAATNELRAVAYDNVLNRGEVRSNFNINF